MRTRAHSRNSAAFPGGYGEAVGFGRSAEGEDPRRTRARRIVEGRFARFLTLPSLYAQFRNPPAVNGFPAQYCSEVRPLALHSSTRAAHSMVRCMRASVFRAYQRKKEGSCIGY